MQRGQFLIDLGYMQDAQNVWPHLWARIGFFIKFPHILQFKNDEDVDMN